MTTPRGLRIVLLPMHVTEKALAVGPRTRDAHLTAALAEHPDVHEVTIVDRPVTIPELIARKRVRNSTLQHRLRTGTCYDPNVVRVVQPASRAVYGPVRKRSRWWLNAYDLRHLTRASRAEVRETLGACDGVVTFVPTSAPFLVDCGSPVIFDLLDNWLIHPQLGASVRQEFRDSYERVFARADVVTANSERTVELSAQFGTEAHLLPNAVDVAAMRRWAKESHTEWCSILSKIPRPWWIYAGKMQQRIDVSLLGRLADTNLGSVILAGQVLDRAWMTPILRHPRVHWLGDIHYRRLPGLINCADVSLVPHHVGAGEVGGDPIKVYEYGSLGSRIVMTAIGGAERFRPYAFVCGSDAEFVSKVLQLGLDDRPLDARYDESVAEGWLPSWGDRARRMIQLIVAELQEPCIPRRDDAPGERRAWSP